MVCGVDVSYVLITVEHSRSSTLRPAPPSCCCFFFLMLLWRDCRNTTVKVRAQIHRGSTNHTPCKKTEQSPIIHFPSGIKLLVSHRFQFMQKNPSGWLFHASIKSKIDGICLVWSVQVIQASILVYRIREDTFEEFFLFKDKRWEWGQRNTGGGGIVQIVRTGWDSVHNQWLHLKQKGHADAGRVDTYSRPDNSGQTMEKLCFKNVKLHKWK